MLSEGRGFLQFLCEFFFCDMVREVVPIVLSEIYLFDFESNVICSCRQEEYDGSPLAAD